MISLEIQFSIATILIATLPVNTIKNNSCSVIVIGYHSDIMGISPDRIPVRLADLLQGYAKAWNAHTSNMLTDNRIPFW